MRKRKPRKKPKTTKYFAVPRPVDNKSLGKMISESARRAKDPVQSAASTLGKLNTERVAVQIGATLIEKVVDATIKGDSRVPAVSINSVMSANANMSNAGKRYKTSFDAGKAASRSVLAAEKIGGTIKRTFYDSQVSTTAADDRKGLSINWGFNEKAVAYFDTATHWTFNDLENLTKASSFSKLQNVNQRPYLLTKFFGQRYTIYNKNKYLPATVKVTFYNQMDLFDSAFRAASKSFTGNEPTQTNTNIESVTNAYQLSGRQDLGYRSQTMMDPVIGTLSASKGFKGIFDKVKTFSKKLLPGESWIIDYKHHTGAGIDVSKMIYTQAESENIGSDAACFYYPIFECKGVNTECINSTDTELAYTGTSPGSIQVEHVKYYEAARDVEDMTEYLTAATGYLEDNIAVKMYSDYGTDSNDTLVKRFHVPYSDILSTGESAAADKYIIPVTTDANVRRAGQSNEG